MSIRKISDTEFELRQDTGYRNDELWATIQFTKEGIEINSELITQQEIDNAMEILDLPTWDDDIGEKWALENGYVKQSVMDEKVAELSKEIKQLRQSIFWR